MTDSAFDYFLQRSGPPLCPTAASRDVIDAHRERLPTALLDIWNAHGWCGYAGGRYWTVNPSACTDIVAAWFQDTELAGSDDYFVVGRSAFGRLDVWGSRTGSSLSIECAQGLVFVNPAAEGSLQRHGPDIAVQAYFITRKPDLVDFLDDQGAPLFERALHAQGALDATQM